MFTQETYNSIYSSRYDFFYLNKFVKDTYEKAEFICKFIEKNSERKSFFKNNKNNIDFQNLIVAYNNLVNEQKAEDKNKISDSLNLFMLSDILNNQMAKFDNCYDVKEKHDEELIWAFEEDKEEQNYLLLNKTTAVRNIHDLRKSKHTIVNIYSYYIQMSDKNISYEVDEEDYNKVIELVNLNASWFSLKTKKNSKNNSIENRMINLKNIVSLNKIIKSEDVMINKEEKLNPEIEKFSIKLNEISFTSPEMIASIDNPKLDEKYDFSTSFPDINNFVK